MLPSGVVEKQHVFDSEHRGLTVGIILGITLMAFEGLAVVTIAPSVASSLGGMALYGWVFSGFLLASLLSVVVGGVMADRTGPGRPFTLGLVLFGVGLLTSGFAPTMPVLILGRVLQGLGGGALVTSTYVAVTVAYPDALRARMMAFMSSAWVLPALLGPAAAGFVAEALGWRLVFWGIAPLLVLVAALTVPAFHRLNHSLTHDAPEGALSRKEKRLLAAFKLVAGTGLFLSGLSVSPWWLGAVMAVAGRDSGSARAAKTHPRRDAPFASWFTVGGCGPWTLLRGLRRSRGFFGAHAHFRSRFFLFCHGGRHRHGGDFVDAGVVVARTARRAL